ncbi:MAG: AraC family transcriptional regulator [Spirochaetes bacterium]|nr:AraC family transcriptional regulator [Spirochaetota bacterium]
MKYKILGIEFGIKHLSQLKSSLVFQYADIEVNFSNSFLDIAEIIYMERINLIILSDFRGREKTSVYIRMLRTVFHDVKIIILTNEKKIGTSNKVYYQQKGADDYLFYDEYEILKDKIKEEYQLLLKSNEDNNWRFSTNKIIRLLKDHYFLHDNIGEKLSSLTGYSLSTIYHCVKADTGKTLGQWITEMRIKGAKELLITSNYPINYVAYKVGYKSPQGIIKAFKKEMNQTPKKFRFLNQKI